MKDYNFYERATNSRLFSFLLLTENDLKQNGARTAHLNQYIRGQQTFQDHVSAPAASP